MLTVTIPSYFGGPATPQEIVYLRDVLRAEFDRMVTPCDNPRLRGAWLFRRFRTVDGKVVQVWLQDSARNIVAKLDADPENRTLTDWSGGECDEWEKYARGKRTPPHLRK